jgi:hypothetical protein
MGGMVGGFPEIKTGMSARGMFATATVSLANPAVSRGKRFGGLDG